MEACYSELILSCITQFTKTQQIFFALHMIKYVVSASVVPPSISFLQNETLTPYNFCTPSARFIKILGQLSPKLVYRLLYLTVDFCQNQFKPVQQNRLSRHCCYNYNMCQATTSRKEQNVDETDISLSPWVFRPLKQPKKSF